MGLQRHEVPYAPGSSRTETDTRITGDSNYVHRARVQLELSGPLTRPELELLISLIIVDLVDGNAKAGGERYDDLCLAYRSAHTDPKGNPR